MNIVDIIILVVLIAFAIIGFNRGIFKSLIAFLGFVAVIFLAYMFKNYIGDFFVLNLPFIDFGKSFFGVSSINIVMYQALAFVIMLVVFGLIYRFLVTISGIFEKVLKLTVILGIPSKLLGMVFGVLEGIIVIYLSLFVLSQPFFKIEPVNDSKFTKIILNQTPIVSSYAENSLRLVREIQELSKIEDSNEKDLKISELILKENVTSPDVMKKLVEMGKLEIEGIDEVLNQYSSN